MNKTLLAKARRAAAASYESDDYGTGYHDWQAAVVSACAVLQDAGFAHDEAYELGREIAADIVRHIDENAEEQG